MNLDNVQKRLLAKYSEDEVNETIAHLILDNVVEQQFTDPTKEDMILTIVLQLGGAYIREYGNIPTENELYYYMCSQFCSDKMSYEEVLQIFEEGFMNNPSPCLDYLLNFIRNHNPPFPYEGSGSPDDIELRKYSTPYGDFHICTDVNGLTIVQHGEKQFAHCYATNDMFEALANYVKA